MTAKEWLQKAKAEKFAIGAFNVGNLETFKAVIQAASNKKSPVIIESSPGETEWMEASNIVDVAKNYSEELKIPILVNLDHGNSLNSCLTAIEAGYDLVHFDGSKLPYEENLATVKQVVAAAHAKNLLVEGEIDHIAGSSEVHHGSAETEAVKSIFTDPQKAKIFVEQSGIDIFAAFFGNVHGVFSEGGENLDLKILENLKDLLPNTFFSLHGGSGIPETQVKQAIALGIVKININTELRQMFRKTLESAMNSNPDEIAMYKIEPPVIDAIQKLVEEKIEIFGSGRKT